MGPGVQSAAPPAQGLSSESGLASFVRWRGVGRPRFSQKSSRMVPLFPTPSPSPQRTEARVHSASVGAAGAVRQGGSQGSAVAGLRAAAEGSDQGEAGRTREQRRAAPGLWQELGCILQVAEPRSACEQERISQGCKEPPCRPLGLSLNSISFL